MQVQLFRFLILFLLLLVPVLGYAIDENNVLVGDIKISGNKKTKPYIIFRELTFKTGDTLAKDKINGVLARNKQNVLNTYLFTFVTVTGVENTTTRAFDISIDVKEAWYTWPQPIFEIFDPDVNQFIRNPALNKVKYGLYLTQDNVGGRNESTSLGFYSGYEQAFSFSYSKPYIGKTRMHGMSGGMSYSRSRTISYKIERDLIRTFFPIDFNDYVRTTWSGSLRYSYRPSLYTRHFVGLSYRHATLNDTILSLNPEYIKTGSNVQRYGTLSYTYRYDNRDYKPYALKGFFIELDLNKIGLGILNDNTDAVYASLTTRKYWPLGGRFYLTSGLKGRAAVYGAKDYTTQIFLGYEPDYIHGFENYTMLGNAYLLQRNSFRFALLQNKVIRVNLIPLENFRTIPNSFYISLNADGGYMHSEFQTRTNRLINKFVYGYGIGLDYITYYGWVFKAEYSVLGNNNQPGFYLHFINPI